MPHRRHLFLPLLAGAVALLVAAAPAGAARHHPRLPGSGTVQAKIRVCVHKRTHRARVVRVTQRCRTTELRMTWHRFAHSAASLGGPVVGPAGPQGDTGAQGAPGVAGPAGPSDVYTTAGGAFQTTGADHDFASLDLPAGSYLVQGQGRLLSLFGTAGIYGVNCRLRDRGTDLPQETSASTTEVDADNDTATNDPDAANMLVTAPLTTNGGTVTLHCHGLGLFAYVDQVQLTAIKTGALHVQ